jgi:hypothetical protein
LEFEILQKITKLDANFRLYRRNLIGGDMNWRFIMKIDKIDICSVLKGGKSLPAVKEYYKLYKNFFPQLPQSCPLKVGNYSARNIEIKMGEKDDLNKTAKENQADSLGIWKDVVTSLTPELFPNGIYKSVIQFLSYTSYLTLSYVTEYNYRMSEDNFK